jgi:LysR family transcriptional regulator, benzoate and cis,cis-muconate-responsive activator of ben and cat genes
MAQPPLSRQIQQLEEILDVQLFQRDSRPLQLTETGQFFYAHAVQLLAQTSDLESMTRRVGDTERSLSVGFVGSTLYGMLPKIIRRFRDENTAVELSLHEMSTMDQIRALKGGQIDVGFGRIRHEEPNIRRVILREEKMIVAFPEGHSLSLVKPVLALTDLVNETLIILPKLRDPVMRTKCCRRSRTAVSSLAGYTKYENCRSVWASWRRMKEFLSFRVAFMA